MLEHKMWRIRDNPEDRSSKAHSGGSVLACGDVLHLYVVLSSSGLLSSRVQCVVNGSCVTQVM
jgi:hypothetical protein